MPRLRPISDENELAKIPLGEEVLVELEPAVSGVEIEIGEEPGAGAAEAEADEVDAGGDPDEGDPDPGVAKLKRELKASKAAAARAEQERDAARAQAEQVQAAHQKDTLAASLADAQREEADAQAEYEAAFDVGDGKAIAAAQQKLSRASAKVVQLEGAVEAAEAEPAPRRATAPTADDVAARIDADKSFTNDEKVWLKKHPETLTNARLNAKLGHAYQEAIAEGHTRGSPEYFKFIDTFMGFDTKPAPRTPTDPARRASVSAPVSRDETSVRTGQPVRPTQVRLTPEQRQVAADLGISDKDYAAGLVSMQAEQSANPQKFARR